MRFLGRANVRTFLESPDPMYTDFITRISQKVVRFCCLLKHFEASLTKSVDPDQTAPISGSTLFASILMLNNKQTQM